MILETLRVEALETYISNMEAGNAFHFADNIQTPTVKIHRHELGVLLTESAKTHCKVLAIVAISVALATFRSFIVLRLNAFCSLVFH